MIMIIMPSVQIYLSELEDTIVNRLSDKWNMAKYETIRKIIRDFTEKKAEVPKHDSTTNT